MATDPRALVPVSFTKRLTQAVNYGLSGGWFTPEMPLVAQQPQTAGRRFDYLAGYNISTRPRRDTGIDFQALRNFAYYYDILRLLLERRKDQIATFEWKIVPTDEATESGQATQELKDRAAAATKFFKCPDGRNSWNTWLRPVLEDMLVLDAVSIWPVYEGKRLLRLELVDPSTIKIVIDESGRRPEPPYPAYQQVLHGVPTADFQKDELFYFISNPASNRVYGLSKVEQCVITIQIGLRRETSQLQFFTDGNVPAALVGVPDNWPAAVIEKFQETFDSILAGDTAARRKIWFVPGEAAKNMKEFRSEEALLKTPFDEWIVRILCFNLGIAPTPFINQVNRATAEHAGDEARDEGLGPTLMFLKDVIDSIITNCLKLDGIEFKWEMEDENDPHTQSTIDDLDLRNGKRGLDEIRQRDGLPPVGVGPMIYLPSGPIPVEQIKDGTAQYLQPPPPPVAPMGGGGPPGAGGGPPKGGAATGAKKPTSNPAPTAKPTNVDTAATKPKALSKAQEGRLSKARPFRVAKSAHYYLVKGRRPTPRTRP